MTNFLVAGITFLMAWIIVFGTIALIALFLLIARWWRRRAQRPKLIYIICPVRGLNEIQKTAIENYVALLERDGYQVHFPPRDVDQTDPVGLTICLGHLKALKKSDRVDIFWDVNSKGSHYDLGMAFALGKKLKLVKTYQPDTAGKSFLKVIKALEERQKH